MRVGCSQNPRPKMVGHIGPQQVYLSLLDGIILENKNKLCLQASTNDAKKLYAKKLLIHHKRCLWAI